MFVNSSNVSLTTEDSDYLLQCMKQGVKGIVLGSNVHLDIEHLCHYDGGGTCNSLDFRRDYRYWEQVVNWAKTKGWRESIYSVIRDN